MARPSIFFGLAMCVVSLVGMTLAPEKTPTQFVPMMAGIPLFFLGIVALNPHRRRLATYACFLSLVPALAYAATRSLQLLGHDLPIENHNQRLLSAMALLAVIHLGWALGVLYRTRRIRRTTVRLHNQSDDSPGSRVA